MKDRHQDERVPNRRVFLRGGIIFSGAALAGAALLRGAEKEKQSEEKEIEVGPPEDLMREHGVLKRVLLIYGEALRRLGAKQDFPPDALATAAGIIRSFVEDYHEKLEEDVLFPRFEKKEDELFGEDGFEKVVDKVAGIEKRLGIYDLAQFTPKI